MGSGHATHGHGVRAVKSGLRAKTGVKLVIVFLAGSGRIRHALIWALAVVALLFWSDWPAIRTMFDRWMNDPRYSHGVLVPAFAGYLLWHRRTLCPGPLAGPNWMGMILIVAGVASQLAGALVFFGWLEGLALISVLGGVVTLWGGPKALRWAAPSLAFLIFMIPLPYRIEVALGGPLQRIGTLASTYALQTVGLAAIAEGNIIRLDDKASIAVVEACNGLGMLVAFACYATAAAMVMEGRGPIARSLILLSAVPLALLANITRITATGLVHSTLGGGAADLVFHDLAGWLMMPLALALLWGELALLGALIVKREESSLASSLKHGLAPAAVRRQ